MFHMTTLSILLCKINVICGKNRIRNILIIIDIIRIFLNKQITKIFCYILKNQNIHNNIENKNGINSSSKVWMVVSRQLLNWANRISCTIFLTSEQWYINITTINFQKMFYLTVIGHIDLRFYRFINSILYNSILFKCDLKIFTKYLW